MTELVNAPLRQIAAAIASGEVTSETITRAFLDRIEAVNGPLNAVVCMDAETALKRAKNADAALKAGDLRGPLHGVPITLKDSLDTIDHVTTWGTTGRREVRPGADATCVARLRDAGAVVLGKTNTPEFTLSFETDNLVYGQTSNPYDQSLTPGGSSGGAAAIIAAGGSPFDVGTDTGGSIRLPAHFCGIVGLKPTTGRIPCTGNALPTSGLLAPLSQPGPMGRFVDDIAYTLPVMAGPDNQDPNAVDAVLHDPDAVDVDDLRIAWHADNGIRTPSADIVRAVTDAVDRLRESGHEVTESRPPGLEMAYFIMNRVFGADSGDLIEMLIEDAHTTDVSPALQNSLASHRAQPDMNQREFAQVMMLWHNYKSSMLSFFNDFDVLLCPVNASTAIPHGTTREIDGYSHTAAYNLTGWPGLVVRAGTDSAGLPIGIQILARPFREDQCIAVGRVLESLLGDMPGPQI
tara:strand:+ start:715 stop:2103 length:1389 start_codon:yes stop_codon:yes gene_type:complete